MKKLPERTIEIIEENGRIRTEDIGNIEYFKKQLKKLGYKAKLSNDTNYLLISIDDDISNFKGFKKAVGDFNKWQGTARIYADLRDRTVWTDVFTDGNNYNDYHSDKVVEVYNKLWIYEQNTKISMQALKDELELRIEDYLTHI